MEGKKTEKLQILLGPEGEGFKDGQQQCYLAYLCSFRFANKSATLKNPQDKNFKSQ